MGRGAARSLPAAEDRALWAAAMRDVRPLPGRPAAVMPETAASRRAPPPAVENEDGTSGAAAAPVKPFAGIDRATGEKLKRGLRPIEARLDLHGLTQAEAHRALIDFVEASYQSGRRCLLVITGRGLGPDGPGVLKRAVPRWLEEAALRRRIVAVTDAQPRHGGAGALYLLLRRRR